MTKQKTRLGLVLAVLIMTIQAALAEVPRWAVGSFKGARNGAKISLSIQSNGNVEMTIAKGSESTRLQGKFAGSTMTAGGQKYNVERTDEGMKTYEVGSPRNMVSYERVGGGWGGGGSNGNWSNPPDWMEGTFTGYNRKYDVNITLTVSRDGRASAQSKGSNGRLQTQSGGYRNGDLFLDDIRFDTAKQGKGFVMTQANDRGNRVEFTRGPGGGSGGGSTGDYSNPPSWMQGTFSGYNRQYDTNVTLTVLNNGRATAVVKSSGGRTQFQSGGHRGGDIYLDNIRFSVSRQDNGLRLTQADDRGNRMDLERGSGNGGGGGGDNDQGDPASWAIGDWRGFNLRYDSDNDLTINRSGAAVVKIRFRDGRRQTQYGRATGDRLVLDGIGFKITKTRDGMRCEQLGDRNNWMEYSRNGGGDDNWGLTAPDWAVGTFSGFNRFYDADIELTITRNGDVRAYVTHKDGRRQTQNGKYERGDFLKIEGIRFTISSYSRGVRVVQVDDRDNACDYRRR